MDSLPAFLRDIESSAFWRSLAPWLHVGARGNTPAPQAPPLPQNSPWPASGYLEINAILDPATTNALARALSALHARSLHPTFLYVYDEAWRVVDTLRPRLAPFLGADVDVLPDVWAWYVDPRTDRGGWPIHRGVDEEDVRDANGTPDLVNVWVALTDAGVRNACMHLVPLPRDPHYPGDLRNLGALEDLGVALPTPSGSALVWNANVAHWGGTCDPSFNRPRLSMSFTLRRRSKSSADVRLPPPSLRERIDLIADQFSTYGERELGPDRNEMRWAAMVEEMRVVLGRSALNRSPSADGRG